MDSCPCCYLYFIAFSISLPTNVMDKTATVLYKQWNITFDKTIAYQLCHMLYTVCSFFTLPLKYLCLSIGTYFVWGAGPVGDDKMSF